MTLGDRWKEHWKSESTVMDKLETPTRIDDCPPERELLEAVDSNFFVARPACANRCPGVFNGINGKGAPREFTPLPHAGKADAFALFPDESVLGIKTTPVIPDRQVDFILSPSQ